MRKIQIVPISKKEEMRGYFSDYLTELAQFDSTITFDKNGKPIYNWFDVYWTEKGRYPFYLIVDEVVAGLALIREIENMKYEIAEFYVCTEFRKDDNAVWFASQLINLFDGEFAFFTDRVNLRAVRFWTKVADLFKNAQSTEDETRKYWILKG